MSNKSFGKIAIPLNVILSIFIVILIIAICILAFTPPVNKDALTHHLAIPKLYLQHGGIYEIPSMIFSYYPMNVDLLYLISIYFGNDIIPKYIHFFFGLLTSCLIFIYLKYRINISYAIFGTIFFLSIPVIVNLSVSVYVDLGLIFFTTVSVLTLFIWMKNTFSLKWLILSAVSCGLAMGTKYNGLISFLLLSFFMPFLYSKYARDDHQRSFNALKYGVLFFFVALFVFSPWMIRNYTWTGNPIYPLYDNVLNPQHSFSSDKWGLFTYRAIVYHESWWEMVLLPIRIFFQGQDGNPQYFDGKLNPFLLFFSAAAFFRVQRDTEILKIEKKILILFSGLFFLIALFSSGLRIRYILPIVPPMCLLSVFGVKRLSEVTEQFISPLHRQLGRTIILFLVLFSLSINGTYILDQFRYIKPFDYIRGELTRDQYIEKYRPEYASMRYINNNLPSDTKILFIFIGNRGYYCDREYVFDMIQNRSTLRQLVIQSNTSEQVLQGLKRLGINHLLIHYDLFNKWVGMNFEFQDQQRIISFFQKHVELLFAKHGYGLYRVEID